MLISTSRLTTKKTGERRGLNQFRGVMWSLLGLDRYPDDNGKIRDIYMEFTMHQALF